MCNQRYHSVDLSKKKISFRLRESILEMELSSLSTLSYHIYLSSVFNDPNAKVAVWKQIELQARAARNLKSAVDEG